MFFCLWARRLLQLEWIYMVIGLFLNLRVSYCTQILWKNTIDIFIIMCVPMITVISTEWTALADIIIEHKHTNRKTAAVPSECVVFMRAHKFTTIVFKCILRIPRNGIDYNCRRNSSCSREKSLNRTESPRFAWRTCKLTRITLAYTGVFIYVLVDCLEDRSSSAARQRA